MNSQPLTQTSRFSHEVAWPKGSSVLAGLILAGLSALINFTFTPYYPVWSL